MESYYSRLAACFSFCITDHAVPQSPVSAGEAHDRWHGRCVCVWGDDPADMRMAEHLLERCGVFPRYAESQEDIQSRLTNEIRADAVLCNLDMPGLIEKLPEFREILPDVPWISFSNWTAPLDEKIKSYCSAFIDRPLRPEQLYGALMSIPESTS